MPELEFSQPAEDFNPTCSNDLPAVRGESQAGNCRVCVTPIPSEITDCRFIWTPEPTRLYRSDHINFQMNGPNATYNFAPVWGNEVSDDPWSMTGTNNRFGDGFTIAAFLDTLRTPDPATTAGAFPDLTEYPGPFASAELLNQMFDLIPPPLFWTFQKRFLSDPDCSLFETQQFDLPGTFVSRKSDDLNVPSPLTEAEIVALGFSPRWPTFGQQNLRGPCISVEYGETATVTMNSRFVPGLGPLHTIISFEHIVGPRTSVYATARSVGTFPNRQIEFGTLEVQHPVNDTYEIRISSEFAMVPDTHNAAWFRTATVPQVFPSALRSIRNNEVSGGRANGHAFNTPPIPGPWLNSTPGSINQISPTWQYLWSEA